MGIQHQEIELQFQHKVIQFRLVVEQQQIQQVLVQKLIHLEVIQFFQQ
tara:strand:- start:530 stop:673 length:144 start_codon:yes stop_codon:yes gene_type:complete